MMPFFGRCQSKWDKSAASSRFPLPTAAFQASPANGAGPVLMAPGRGLAAAEWTVLVVAGVDLDQAGARVVLRSGKD